MKSHLANVIDSEWSCYPGGLFPEGERKEVIEIGFTTVNLRTLTIVKTFSVPIIPTMSKISPYCTELTGWTEAKLRRQGMSYERGMKLLAADKHGFGSRLLVTDHAGESAALKAQCELMGIESPFGDQELNISNVIASATGIFRNLSLDEKLAIFKLGFEGLKHRGGNDSLNIARLFVAAISWMRSENLGLGALALPITGSETSA